MWDNHRNGDNGLPRQHFSDKIYVPPALSIDTIFGSPEEEASLVVQAVCWMREANLGYHPQDGRKNFRTCRQVQTYQLINKWQGWFTLTNMLYFGFAFLEIPDWCGKACPQDENIPMMNRSGYVPEEFLIPFEVCLLSVYILRLWMRREIFEHARSKLMNGWRKMSFACVGLSLASIVIAGFMGQRSILHRLLRVPIFISFTRGLRNTIVRVVKMIPDAVDSFVMLFMTIFFFSWMGLVFYDYTPAGKPFLTLLKSLKHMYITLTTDNMPNIMMPTIEMNAYNAFFYVIYATLSIHLLMNVLLADQYDSYRGLLRDSIVEIYTNRRLSVDFAYSLVQELEGGGEGIGVETFEKFLNELVGPCGKAAGVLEILDDDGSGKIEIGEFRLVAEVLGDPNFHVASDEHWNGVERLKPLAPFVERYDKFCDHLSVLAFAITLWQTTYFVSADDVYQGVDLLCCTNSGFNIALFVISLAYALELALEILGNGWHKFMHSDPFQNKFDLLTVCALVPLEFYYLLPGTDYFCPVAPCRAMSLLRGVRCLRCVHKYEGPRNILVKVYNGMESFSRVLLLVFCIMYFCAQVGMIVLGGKIRRDHEILQHTAYAENDFWDLNFNDLPSSLYLMWSHLVGANAHIWMNSFNAAFGWPAYAASFAFDVVCRIILLNIIIALVIDCVLVPIPEQKEGEDFEWPDREDQIRTMFADGGDEEEEADDEEGMVRQHSRKENPLRMLTEDELENRAKVRELLGGE